MRWSLCLAMCAALAGCRGSREVLPRLSPGAPPLEYTLDVPAGFDVVRTEFGASYATSISGDNVLTGASATNAYVYVYATERATAQQAVLVYGDLRERTTPIAIIRLRLR